MLNNISSILAGAAPKPALVVDYLVVAGGGAGPSELGGGG